MIRPVLLMVAFGLSLAIAGAAIAQDSFDSEPLRQTEQQPITESASPSSGPSLARVVGSLGVVAVLIVALGWAYRRFASGNASTGAAAVSLVSRTMLTPKHQVMVLRVGHRLVVVGDAGHGMNALCQITDPAEVTAVLTAVGGGQELQALRGAAFEASLDSADSEFDPLESEPREDEPLDSMAPMNEDVRALIERVRGIAGKGTGLTTAATQRDA